MAGAPCRCDSQAAELNFTLAELLSSSLTYIGPWGEAICFSKISLPQERLSIQRAWGEEPEAPTVRGVDQSRRGAEVP